MQSPRSVIQFTNSLYGTKFHQIFNTKDKQKFQKMDYLDQLEHKKVIKNIEAQIGLTIT